MGSKNEPGDLYWQKIATAFDAVSIYDGPSLFAEQFAKLTPEVGHILAAHWCQSEVCNGGFHQFFSNSTGVLAPEALVGFQAIGLHGLASLLREAMNLLGPNYPRDREQRQRLLAQPVRGKRREEWDYFSSLDDRFYECLNVGESVWEKAADAYAVAAVA